MLALALHLEVMFQQSSRKRIYSVTFRVSGIATIDDCCCQGIASVLGMTPGISR
jgi:hypothetical protein